MNSDDERWDYIKRCFVGMEDDENNDETGEKK